MFYFKNCVQLIFIHEFFLVNLRALVSLWLNFRTPHFATKTLRHEEHEVRNISYPAGFTLSLSLKNNRNNNSTPPAIAAGTIHTPVQFVTAASPMPTV